MPDAIDRAVNTPTGLEPTPVLAMEDNSQDPTSTLDGDPIIRQDGASGSLYPDGPADKPLGDSKPLAAPKDNAPDPEEQQRGYLRQQDYTRKTMELAEQRRALEHQQLALQQMQNQLLTAQSGSAQPPANNSVLRQVIPEANWEAMDPEAKAVWSTLDQGLKVAMDQMRSEFQQNNQPAVDPNFIGTLFNEVTTMKADQQLTQLGSKYGQEVVGQYADQIKTTMRNYPGVSAEQILDSLNPEIRAQYYMQQGAKRAEASFAERQQQAQAGLLGQGGGPQISAEYREGESVAETAMRVMGQNPNSVDPEFRRLAMDTLQTY